MRIEPCRQRLVCGLRPDAVAGVVAAADALLAVHEQVVVHDIIAAAVDLHRTETSVGAADENVAIDQHAADGIVEADRSLAADGALGTGLAAVDEAVVAEYHATVGGVAEQLHRALVIGFLRTTLWTALNSITWSLPSIRMALLGTVIHQVVRYAVAHAFELDRRRVGPVDAAEVVDPAVLDKVAAGLQGGAVAANDFGGPPADGVNVAPNRPSASPP